MSQQTQEIITCRDIHPEQAFPKNGSLNDEEYRQWVELELQLGMAYAKDGCAVSALPAGDPKISLIVNDPILRKMSGIQLKDRMLNHLESFFVNHTSLEICRKFETKWRAEFEARLENPGLLRNFYFFDVPSSELMIQFYLKVWEQNMPDVMDLLHNTEQGFSYIGFDGQLKRELPADDSWSVMSNFEAMNVSERKKSAWLCGKYRRFFYYYHRAPRIVGLGAGNITERNINLPQVIYTAFDKSPFVRSPEEIFPGFRENDQFNRQNLNYFHDDFFSVLNHPELFGQQDFVTIVGVSMYCTPEQLQNLMSIAHALLRPNGTLLINYLVMTDSVRRIALQGWPGANSPVMQNNVFLSHAAAYQRACEDLREVNRLVKTSGSEDAPFSLHQWSVTEVKPWGAQNCLFEMWKHSSA